MSIFSISKFKFFSTTKTVKSQQATSTSKTSWNPLKGKSASAKKPATDQFTKIEQQVQQAEVAAHKAHSQAQAKLNHQFGKFNKQDQKLAQAETAFNRGLDKAAGTHKIDDAEVNALIQQTQRQVAKEQTRSLPKSINAAPASGTAKKPATYEELQARFNKLQGPIQDEATLAARLKRLKGEKLTTDEMIRLLPEAPKG